MNDLEWLARNVEVWPDKPKANDGFVAGSLYYGPHASGIVYWKSGITKQQWQQKREELNLNKPSQPVTLRRGDGVNVEGLSQYEFDQLCSAFINAGAVDVYDNLCRCEYIGYKYLEWSGDEFECTTARPERLLTTDQVLNATNAQATAVCEAGELMPEVGQLVEIHNDLLYTLAYGSDVIGESGKVMATYKSGNVDVAVVEVRGVGYCFNVELVRPIKTEREKLIEKAAEALGELCPMPEVLEAIIDADMLKMPEE